MVIKTSSGKQIDAFVADLSSSSGLAREAAVARLIVIGARAVGRLLAVVDSKASSEARAAAPRALDAIGDPHVLAPALHAVDDADMTVASAAITAVRAFLRGPHGAGALDKLTETALNTALDERVRLAAIHAIGDLEPATLRPIWRALGEDPNAAVRAEAATRQAGKPAVERDPAEQLAAAAGGAMPAEAAILRRSLSQADDRVALTTLQRIVERLREQEAAEPDAARRAQWTIARGAAHVVLAHRGSRLALYDLRESLEAADAPLPVEFLAALSEAGDVSCLEPIAAAYAQSVASGRIERDWWHERLADAFRAIVKRERVTRRHAVLKKIQKRWGAVAGELAGRQATGRQ